MRRFRLVAGVLAFATMSGAYMTGCFFTSADDCGLNLSCGEPSGPGAGGGSSSGMGGGGPDDKCVPGLNPNGAVGDDCGIFVELGGDDGGDGTKESPVKTLAKAAGLAKSGQNIYACGQVFPEALELPAGVSLFGGLDCMGDWGWKPDSTRTSITPMTDMVALKVGKGSGVVRVEDVDARAADATVAGGSSIAVIVDGSTVDFARCDFLAGNGAAGEKGATPMDPVGPSDSTDPAIAGKNGAAACSGMVADGNPGGEQIVNGLCDASIGAAGGKGLEGKGENGADGSPAGTYGKGGVGQPNSGMWSCVTGAGQIGDNGADGVAGAGGTEPGQISIAGYVGAAGADGSPGSPGQGGGGGGGAKGKLSCNGASGGGGGAGGCGGKGGLGGKAGGSSIALISLDANLTLTDVRLTAGLGGGGGDGGDGQVGGVGGSGGVGGAGMNTLKGCNGGDGGQGGFGGRGGGGRGGHSVGLAFTGTSPSAPMDATVGTAGVGGKGAEMMQDGAAGVSQKTMEFPATP